MENQEILMRQILEELKKINEKLNEMDSCLYGGCYEFRTR